MVAAHLILGPREEPFLSAMLDSISEAASLLIVNDNGPHPSPHTAVLAASSFGASGRLLVDRTPFAGFAEARNVCLRLHDEARWRCMGRLYRCRRSAWPARAADRAASRPPVARRPFLDGYTWHFFGSFDYYTSIERRMMFFRYRPVCVGKARCTSSRSAYGKRLALPYVYAHYGHTLEPRRDAEKGRHYSALGAPGNVLREEQLDDFDVVRYFKPLDPLALRFTGRHPQAARETLDVL